MIIGFHVNKESQSIPSAIVRESERVKKYGFIPSCYQIFVTGPRNSLHTLSDEDISILRKSKNRIIIHGAYIDNSWNVKSMKNIQDELTIAEKIGADGVVIHLSSKTNDNLSMLKNLKTTSTLYLEINPALPTINTFETPEKICALFDAVKKLKLSYNVGLCIDSAHLFSLGTSLREYPFTKKFLSSMPSVDIIFHLNDSASKLRSGKDEHDELYRGHIWNGMEGIKSGIDAIIEYAHLYKCPIILERSKGKLDGDIKTFVKYFL